MINTRTYHQTSIFSQSSLAGVHSAVTPNCQAIRRNDLAPFDPSVFRTELSTKMKDEAIQTQLFTARISNHVQALLRVCLNWTAYYTDYLSVLLLITYDQTFLSSIYLATSPIHNRSKVDESFGYCYVSRAQWPNLIGILNSNLVGRTGINLFDSQAHQEDDLQYFLTLNIRT